MIDILVIGLGKLGLPLAAVCAEAGFSVLGYDQDVQAVAAAEECKPRFPEPRLVEILKANRERLYFSNGFPKQIKDCKAIFVVVPTPSLEDGTFSSKQVADVLKEVSRNTKLTAITKPPTCIVSTLFPGTTRKLADEHPYLRLFYTPTMIALGNVMEGLRRPDFQLVGNDADDGADIEQVFAQIHSVNGREPAIPLTKFMPYESAEVAKLAANAFVTMKISFANRIGEICGNIDNADVADVLGAIGNDRRIGHQYLKAGAPYGGPCFPRDVEAMAQLDPLLGYSIFKMNDATIKAIALRAHEACPDGKPIMIMGVSYKPGLPTLDGSPSMAVHAELTRFYKRKCYLWDPCGPLDENPDWIIIEGLIGAPSDVACLIFMHPRYGEGNIRINDDVVIIDPWHRPTIVTRT